jgi:hypothetical protein
LAVIKAELGLLKQEGKLAGSAAKIHESMLTPKHGPSKLPMDEALPACIPEKPLLQNDVAKGLPHTYQARDVAGVGSTGLHASWSGRKQNHRSCNFVYANGLSAYPPSRSTHGEVCSDPLSNCPPQGRTNGSQQISLHALKARQMFCQGDDVVRLS